MGVVVPVPGVVVPVPVLGGVCEAPSEDVDGVVVVGVVVCGVGAVSGSSSGCFTAGVTDSVTQVLEGIALVRNTSVMLPFVVHTVAFVMPAV